MMLTVTGDCDRFRKTRCLFIYDAKTLIFSVIGWLYGDGKTTRVMRSASPIPSVYVCYLRRDIAIRGHTRIVMPHSIRPYSPLPSLLVGPFQYVSALDGQKHTQYTTMVAYTIKALTLHTNTWHFGEQTLPIRGRQGYVRRGSSQFRMILLRQAPD
ncbi:hypothetical protein F5Y14DRAFT_69339 [Nemania sp. NC0429]|nr:hypothetical protein F5Y14DRAFT_69339 [Nemania sp. NC0429]